MTITLRPMRFYAYHGVLEQETRVGNHFSINLSVEADIEASLLSDELTDTLNYAELYASVADEMTIASKLLEHVVGRIIKRLFADFACIRSIDIALVKYNPPFEGDVQEAEVRLQMSREEAYKFFGR